MAQDWKVRFDGEEKSPIMKDLKKVETIFQQKVDLFVEELNKEIEGVHVLSFLSDGLSGRIKVSGLCIDSPDLNKTSDEIKRYIELLNLEE